MTEQRPLDRRLMAMDSTLDQHEFRMGKAEQAIAEQHDELTRAKSAFAGLNDVVQKLVKKDEEPPTPPFSWLTARDREQAEVKLETLSAWADTILIHFPKGRLKDCWRRHPNVVEELLVLQEGHDLAWAPKGAAAARFDWLNRWLPETVKRIDPELEKCGGLTSDRHSGADPKFIAAQQPGLDGGEVEHWVTFHGTRMEPAPTEEALVESRARNSQTMKAKYDAARR
jgi:hypothetical protein